MLNGRSLSGKAVVIGAGTMGGGIAAQLANAGWETWLLDIPGPDPHDKKTRNQAAQTGLARMVGNKPPLLFLPEFAARIHVGNTTDDLAVLKDAEWVVEAVVENMDAKKAIMAQIEAQCGAQTLISSNTSGLSLRAMTAERGSEFRARFLGTHFLNPPRYLKLLEVIPLPETAPDILAGFQGFAEQVLGQRVIVAKDTPGFISTRLWITHLLDTMRAAIEAGLTAEEVDYLTGALVGRPRSATFRMADLVGLDIIANIARNQHDRLEHDPFRERLRLPDVMAYLIQNGQMGDKSGAGFYKREGKNILVLDWQTQTYRAREDGKIEAVENLLRLPLPERLATLRAAPSSSQEPWQAFLNSILDGLANYVNQIGPEIAADALAIDRVMQWGFGWEMGPFAMEQCRETGDTGSAAHFRGTGAERQFRVFGGSAWQSLPTSAEYVSLADLKMAGKTVLEAEGGALIDMGDGVVCLEFHTKMNTFDPGLVAFLNAAREQAERSFRALVIGNQGPHFSAGYNLKLLSDWIAGEDWDALDMAMRDIQAAFMGLKYAGIPVVVAPHGYTLGGGCECALHCHALHAAPELVMGLPERNVGLIPVGGGVKELLARAMAGWKAGEDALPRLERAFERIAFPTNSANAADAQRLGFLREEDSIARNADRQLYEAKEKALALANAGYAPPVKQGVWILGEETLARLRLTIHWQWRAGALSDHDRLIADHVAYIFSGGNLPYPQQISEEYLLQLERNAFLLLAREPKTAERIQHTLTTGKPLKN